MAYAEMMATYSAKAMNAKTIYEVEYALKDIRETLAIHNEQHTYDTLSGNFYRQSAYVQKLLAERDAYLDQYSRLTRPRKSSKKAA